VRGKSWNGCASPATLAFSLKKGKFYPILANFRQKIQKLGLNNFKSIQNTKNSFKWNFSAISSNFAAENGKILGNCLYECVKLKIFNFYACRHYNESSRGREIVKDEKKEN
jgi:hypothetical protein